MLGAEQLGVYSYTNSIAYYFVLFAMLGVNNYGNRCVARARDDKEMLSREFWGIYSLQALLAFFLSLAYVFYALFIAEDVVVALIWLPYVISAGLDINWLFFGLEEFRLTVARNSIVKLVTFCLTFVVVRGDHALAIYCALLSISYLVSAAALWPFVRSRAPFLRPSPREVLAHAKPNLILFVPVVAVSLYTVLDKIMLGSMSTMEQAGYFENALRVAQMPFALIAALGTVMLPRVSNLLANGKEVEARHYVGSSMWLALGLSAAFAFGLAGVADVFAPVFFGEGFRECGTLICVIVAEMPFMAWANVLRTQHLIPLGRDRAYVVSVFAGAVANIAVNIVLIPRMGAMGAAWGTLAAEVAVCIVQSWAVGRELPQLEWLKEAIPFFIIGAAMFASVHALGAAMGESVPTLTCQVFLGALEFAILSWAWCSLAKNREYEELIDPLLGKILERIRGR